MDNNECIKDFAIIHKALKKMKIKKAIFCLCLLIKCFYTQGQVTFQKYAFIKGCYDVQQTADTGYIIIGIGITYSSTVLYKLNSSGDSVWSKEFGIVNKGAVRQTSDGGYVIVGGVNDVCLIKTNSTGDTLWTKAYGNSGQDGGTYVQQTTDGGYILAGYSVNFSTGDSDAYMIKTNAAGDTLWTRIIGGISEDAANSIQQTSDGGYIVIGYTSSFGAGGSDLFLIKMDNNGTIQWTKTFGGTGNDIGKSVRQTIDGGYIIAGYTSSFGTGYQDTYLVRTDGTGNILWEKTLGNSFSDDFAYSVDITSSNGFIVTGQSGATLSLINLNASGDTLWTKAFGVSAVNYGNTVQQTTDGGFIIGGVSDNGGGTPPNPRAYIIKTDSNGNGGCYQNNVPLIVGVSVSITSPQSPQVFYGSIVSSAAPVISNAAFYNNILCSSSTGINETVFKETIRVFPNPASGIFILNIPGERNKEITITAIDLLGRPVLEKRVVKESEVQIDLSNFPGGVYILKIVEGEKSSLERVILIEQR